MENCRTCSHFIPDAKAPRKGICEAIRKGEAQRTETWGRESNPRVKSDGKKCIATYRLSVRRKSDYGYGRYYISHEYVPAYKPQSPIRALGRYLTSRFNS